MKGLRFFFIGFLLSLPFWLSFNLSEARLENLFFSQFYLPSPEVVLARVFLPKPEIEAKSFLVLQIDPDGSQKIILEKNSKEKLPIASLTKLMTTVVASEALPLNQKVEISQAAVSQEGVAGSLKVGERVEVGELLKMSLVESSNDAAEALAETLGRDKFIEAMNKKADSLGLRSTQFATPTGLEAENNFSTARDLVSLAVFILKEHQPLFVVSSQPSVIILSENDHLHHLAFNTNELLNSFGEVEGFKVVGGKTGYTQEAGGCILLVLRDSNGRYFVSVLLGAKDSESRFVEMRKIVEEIKSRF